MQKVKLPTELPKGWVVNEPDNTNDIDFRCIIDNSRRHTSLVAWVEIEGDECCVFFAGDIMHKYPDITPFPGTAQEAVDYVANLIRMGELP